jgi:hypothetical protein
MAQTLSRIVDRIAARGMPDIRWRGRLWLVILGYTMGCVVSRGELPKVSMISPTDGFKLLRPAATVRVCDGSFRAALGMDAGDLLGIGLRRLLALDVEADAIVNGHVEWSWTSIGVYGWHCVTIEGDVVRAAPTVLLPMPGGHHEGH